MWRGSMENVNIVQVIIYGTTLNDMLHKGVNIPQIMKQYGYDNCVVFDVPQLQEIDTDSCYSPSKSLPTAESAVKEEIEDDSVILDEVNVARRAHCSTPVKDNNPLLNCSLSTIYSTDDGFLASGGFIDEENENEDGEYEHIDPGSAPSFSTYEDTIVAQFPSQKSPNHDENLACDSHALIQEDEPLTSLRLDGNPTKEGPLCENGDDSVLDTSRCQEVFLNSSYNSGANEQEGKSSPDDALLAYKADVSHSSQEFGSNHASNLCKEKSDDDCYGYNKDDGNMEDLHLFETFVLEKVADEIRSEKRNESELPLDKREHEEFTEKSNARESVKRRLELSRSMEIPTKRRPSAESFSHSEWLETITISNGPLRVTTPSTKLIGNRETDEPARTDGKSIVSTDSDEEFLDCCDENLEDSENIPKKDSHMKHDNNSERTGNEGIPSGDRFKKTPRHPIANNQPKEIFCNFKDCGKKLFLKAGFGRNRLMRHVCCHWERRSWLCQFCDHRVAVADYMYYHHKRKHAGIRYEKPLNCETTDEAKKLLELWDNCFPDVPRPSQLVDRVISLE